MQRGWIAIVALAVLGSPMAVNAQAPSVKSLTDVGFESVGDRFEFVVQADAPVAPQAVSARANGPVLMIRIDGLRTDRKWLETPDRSIKRTLLHPSRKHAPAAIVRTRMTRPVAPEMLRNIRVRTEGGALVVAVPRDAVVARGWAAADANPAPAQPASLKAVAEAPEANPAPGDTQPVAPLAAEPSVRLTFAAPAVAGAPGGAADDDAPLDDQAEPLALGDSAPLLAVEPDVQVETVAAGLVQAGPDGPSLGAYLMSLLFLTVVGFIMWRKMRGAKATASGKPIIRPVGSHMLGPKQSLLLVDVAGEMVLLGTSDKGVQMLTKISNDADSGETPVPVVPSAQAAPASAVAGGSMVGGSVVSGSFAERLGQAVSRFRQAAARMEQPAEPAAEVDDGALPTPDLVDRAAERRFFAREKAAVREAAEMDALDALARQVEDPAPQIDSRRFARRNFAPIAPAAVTLPTPPESDPAADLLRKIRSLQSA